MELLRIDPHAAGTDSFWAQELENMTAAADERGPASEPSFKVFHCANEDSDVEADDAVSTPLSAIRQLAAEVLATEDSFIGLIDRFDTTLQFYRREGDEVMVDIPALERSGSYSATVSLKRALEIIDSAREPLLQVRESLQLEFARW